MFFFEDGLGAFGLRSLPCGLVGILWSNYSVQLSVVGCRVSGRQAGLSTPKGL